MDDYRPMTASEARRLREAEAVHDRVGSSAQLIMASLAGAGWDVDPAQAASLAIEWSLALEAQLRCLPNDTRILERVRLSQRAVAASR